MSTQNLPELVVLVDDQDRQIGTMEKVAAHTGEGHQHRAISVFLFRQKNGVVELLTQQRSVHKITCVNQWANTCCGNLWPGESYEACARRRLAQELGIIDPRVELTPITVFHYHVRFDDQFSEWEVDQVFAGWYDCGVEPQPLEVQAFEWLPMSNIFDATKRAELAKKHGQPWVAWLELMMNDQKVVTGLQTFLAKKKD